MKSFNNIDSIRIELNGVETDDKPKQMQKYKKVTLSTRHSSKLQTRNKAPTVVVMDLSSDIEKVVPSGKSKDKSKKAMNGLSTNKGFKRFTTVLEKNLPSRNAEKLHISEGEGSPAKLYKTTSADVSIQVNEESNNETTSPDLESSKSVELTDIEHLKIKLTQMFDTYQQGLDSVLFGSKQWTYGSLYPKFIELMTITREEAQNLAKYFLSAKTELRTNGAINGAMPASILKTKMQKFTGKFPIIEIDLLDELKFNLSFIDDKETCNGFISDLQELCKCSLITPYDILSIVSSLELEIDPALVLKYLCGKSMSMTYIKHEALKEFIEFVKTNSLKAGRLSPLRVNARKMFKSSSTKVKGKCFERDTLNGDQLAEKGQRLFLMLADFLYDNNSTLYKLIHTKIFSKVIDGVEYQLIKLERLYDVLEESGFQLSYQDKICVENFVKPIIRDNVDVDSIRFFLSNLGIEEKLPKSTAHLDYIKLKGPSIRIFNRIIKHMETNNIENIQDLLGEDNIENYEVISREKLHQIQVISEQKLRDVLREIEVIRFGEDLDEEFTDFLSLNDEFSDLIMVSKLKRSLKDIKNCDYFNYFGINRRNEEDVDSGPRKSSKVIRSLSRKIPEHSSEKSISLKSTIEEKHRKVDSQEIALNLDQKPKGYYDIDALDAIQHNSLLVPELGKNISQKSSSTFKSVDLSDIDDSENNKRIMMRKKFGLMPSYKKYKGR